MKNWKNRIIFILMMGMMIGNFMMFPEIAKSAYTKKGVEAKINALKKEIKKLESESDISKENDKRIKNGDVFLSFPGKPISNNPFIFEQTGLLGGKSYYWILKPENLEVPLFGYGWVKPTGNYRYYGNVTCIECVAIKPKKRKDHSKTLKKLKKELTDYETMLEDRVILVDMALSIGEKKK